MKLIGLCGGSGSGKGLVCRFFDEFSIKSIDTDKVYHDLISKDSECTRELISSFGEGISSNSGIDRKKLRAVAFSSDDALRQLNRITHKHILAKVRTQKRFLVLYYRVWVLLHKLILLYWQIHILVS